MNICRNAIKQSISWHWHPQNSGRKILLHKCDNMWLNELGNSQRFGFRNGSFLLPRKAERDFRSSNQRTISKAQLLERAEYDHFLKERHLMTKERGALSQPLECLCKRILYSALEKTGAAGCLFSQKRNRKKSGHSSHTAVTAKERDVENSKWDK